MRPLDTVALSDDQLALLHRSRPSYAATEHGQVADAAAFLRSTDPTPETADWSPPPPRPPGPPLAGVLPLRVFPQEAWAADGFAVVGPFLDREGLGSLADAATRLQATAFAQSGMPSYADWVARISQIPEPADWEPLFETLETHPGITAAAALALGTPSARCLWSHLVLKPPGEGTPLPWHTDRPTWPFPARVPAVAVWLALDPLEEGSGGLSYRPGSHRGLDHARPATRPEVPAGSVLLHHDEVLHCSRANTSPRWRRAWIGVFGAV